ncbi:MAG TPA: hypothetical protein VMV74_09120 [Bacteroidales bacterium]|nr:hypothetical protein [Bacteroidales bacterium]
MNNLPSCNQLASYSDYIAGDFDWTKDGLVKCDYCNGTGRTAEDCHCGEYDNQGLRICKSCGRIVDYIACPDCK